MITSTSKTSTSQAWGITLIRAIVGIVFLMHGGQKLFVWGFHNVAGFLGHIGVPLPGVAAVLLTLVEFLGGAALLIGVLTRAAAALLAIDMLVAVLRVHGKNGLFLPNGFEYALTLLIANIALVVGGSGALAIDNAIAGRHE
ncbi:MAG TPA: DoxX family protein [Terriglobales bacterium]|nr:DoxX family protein [Terriglobales bacterium]